MTKFKLITKILNHSILQFYKIYNLIELWAFSDNKFANSNKLIKENLLSDRETILYLRNNPNVGIIRYGNSELGLIVGNSPKTQKYDKELRDKLVNICRKYNSTPKKKYLLALPLGSLTPSSNNIKRNLPNWYPGLASRWAMKFLLKKKCIYGSPFCFRATEVVDNDMDSYINLVKSLFLNRKIIYVGPLEGKNPYIPDFIISKEILKIPKKNAFEKIEEITSQIKNICKNYKDPLVVIVGGVTACAISYNLNMSNITCYDFGQYERLYKKYLEIQNKN